MWAQKEQRRHLDLPRKYWRIKRRETLDSHRFNVDCCGAYDDECTSHMQVYRDRNPHGLVHERRQHWGRSLKQVESEMCGDAEGPKQYQRTQTLLIPCEDK
jgi:transposase-like protein